MTNPVSITVSVYNQGGGSGQAIASNVILGKLAAQNFYMPNYSITSGTYAMVVSADQQIGAIVRTDWSATGGAAIYGSSQPATDVTLPLILGNFAAQTSQFTVQNTDILNTITDVQITLNGRGLSSPVKTLPLQSIGPGTSKTYSMSDPMWGTLPNTGLDMGATGFVGSVRISSVTPLVAQSFIDLAGSGAVGGYSGVPTNSASSTLYCPLIRANYFGDTGISIVNPNGAGVTANITFMADANSPHQGTFTQALNIGANSSAVAFQGLGGNSRGAPTNLPGGSQRNPLPTNNGFYGVARIVSSDSTKPLSAVVNDTKFNADWSVATQSTYNCGSSGNSGTVFALPLLRRFHLSGPQLTTGIQIQNTSGSPVTVHLDLTNWDGSSQSASDPPDVTIPGNGSGNYWNGTLAGLPTVPMSAGGYGWYGSGILSIVSGTGPVYVVVSDEAFGPSRVDSANYEGVKIQ